MLRTTLAGLFLLAGFLVSGCGSPTTSTDASKDAQTEKVAENATAAAPAADNVQLEILSYDEIQRRLAGKQGTIVVMDAWSTSCPPCMKDFHNLVELHQQYGPEKLACVSMSFDYEGLGKPEEVQEPVLSFLRSQNARFDNWMSSEESDVLYKKFELNSVPAVFVYGQDGKLVKRFESEGAYAEVRKLVEELLTKGGSVAAPAEK